MSEIEELGTCPECGAAGFRLEPDPDPDIRKRFICSGGCQIPPGHEGALELLAVARHVRAEARERAITPYGIAQAFAKAHEGAVEARRVNGRLVWWVRSKKTGLMTLEYGAGVHGRLREFVEEQWPGQIDTWELRKAAEELAALCPHKPTTTSREWSTSDLLAIE